MGGPPHGTMVVFTILYASATMHCGHLSESAARSNDAQPVDSLMVDSPSYPHADRLGLMTFRLPPFRTATFSRLL